MSKIAIIPARGGSKRIPGKNIKLFDGKPVIEHAIYAAIHSGLFNKIIVSTDDDKIAEIASNAGASVPFKRSEENSNDFATTAQVLTEVLRQLEQRGEKFATACCIYPVNPFLTKELIHSAYERMIEYDFDCVFSAVKYGHPIQRAFKIKNHKRIPFFPEYSLTRTQDLEATYHDAAQLYWFKTESFLNSGILIGENTGIIEVAETEMQDIDNETDWQIAELKYTLWKQKKK